MEASIDKIGNTIYVGIAFETIAEYMTFFGDKSFVDKVINDINIES